MRRIGGISAVIALAGASLLGCSSDDGPGEDAGDDATETSGAAPGGTTDDTGTSDAVDDPDDMTDDDPDDDPDDAGTSDAGEGAGDTGSTGDAADDAPPPSVALVTTTTVALPQCTVDTTSVRADWPFPVSDAIVTARHDVDGDLFSLSGVTNRPEQVVGDTLDRSFPDLTAAEPTGGASDIQVDFTGTDADASLAMADPDGDGCWDVQIVAVYTSTPVIVTVPPATAAPEPNDPFDDVVAVGRVEIVTRRGTFQLAATRCELDPVDIVAVGAAGELTVAQGPSVRWVDVEDAVIIDDSPIVAGRTPNGVTMFADGDGLVGPESLVITIDCDAATE